MRGEGPWHGSDALLSSGALQGLTDVGTLPTWAAMFGHTFHEAFLFFILCGEGKLTCAGVTIFLSERHPKASP